MVSFFVGFFFCGEFLLLLDPEVLVVYRITGLGKMQGKPREAEVMVGRAAGMCGGTWKDKPEQKPAPSGAVDEKYLQKFKGEEWEREN